MKNRRWIDTYVALTPGSVAFGAGTLKRYDATHIKLTVNFNTGGLSYYDYKEYPRGFYLSVSPVKREVGVHATTEISTLGTGLGVFLEGAPRFNAKRLTALADLIASRKDYLAGLFVGITDGGSKEILTTKVHDLLKGVAI